MRLLRVRLRRLAVLAITALSFLVGRLADTDHLLNTVHVVCEEHGQLEEQIVEASKARPAGLSPDAAGADRHHSCDMPMAFAGATPAVAMSGGPELRVPVWEGAESPVAAVAPVHAQVPLLAVAPKQGPPQG